jgi:hypothetical protein
MSAVTVQQRYIMVASGLRKRRVKMRVVGSKKAQELRYGKEEVGVMIVQLILMAFGRMIH